MTCRQSAFLGTSTRSFGKRFSDYFAVNKIKEKMDSPSIVVFRSTPPKIVAKPKASEPNHNAEPPSDAPCRLPPRNQQKAQQYNPKTTQFQNNSRNQTNWRENELVDSNLSEGDGTEACPVSRTEGAPVASKAVPVSAKAASVPVPKPAPIPGFTIDVGDGDPVCVRFMVVADDEYNKRNPNGYQIVEHVTDLNRFLKDSK